MRLPYNLARLGHFPARLAYLSALLTHLPVRLMASTARQKAFNHAAGSFSRTAESFYRMVGSFNRMGGASNRTAGAFDRAVGALSHTGKTVSRARTPPNRGVFVPKVPYNSVVGTARFADLIPDCFDRTATPVACLAVALAKAGAIGRMRCQWSRWEASDIDGQTDRDSDRANRENSYCQAHRRSTHCSQIGNIY
jgi:hypothetical protein